MANTEQQGADPSAQPAEAGHDAHAPADAGHGTVATTEAGHGAEAHGAFPPFDASTFPSQILWLTIAFGLLYVLMKRVALPRVGGIIEARNKRILGDIAEANRLKAESEQAAEAYEKALAEARGNAGAIAQKARDAAKADADAERARAEAAVAARSAEAEKSIAAAKGKAMGEVGAIANETADSIVKALVGGAATRAEIEKAVKTALGK